MSEIKPFGWTQSFERLNRIPLETNKIWDTLAKAQEFVDSSPIAVEGDIISVVGDPVVDNNGIYFIKSVGDGAVVGVIEKVGSASESVVIDQKVTVIEGDITNIENNITTVENSITTIEGDITTIEGNITTIEGDITTIENKLNTIASGAEVNVQADWNITDVASDAFIKNKPTGLATETYVDDAVETSTAITPMGVTSLGNITSSTVIPAGTTLEDFIRMLLVKLIDVKATNPTATISISPSVSTTYEIGESLTPNATANYTDGKFTGAEAAYSYNVNAGCTRGATTFFMNNVEIASFSSISLTNNGANQAFKANVAYGASTVTPEKNDGSASAVKINAGTATTSTVTYQARYRYFYGTLGDYTRTDFSNVTTEELKNLSETDTVTNNWLNTSGATSAGSGTYSSGAGNGSVVIACPSDYELTRVNGGLGNDLLGSFTGLETMNYTYKGSTTEYSLYILPIITASGSIDLKDIQITKK